MEHKHASVLRAIADGVPLSEFEIEWIHGTEENAGFKNATFQDLIDAIQFPEHWEIRRKPQYIMVNGFKVPKPLDVMPNDDCFAPSFVTEWGTVQFTAVSKLAECALKNQVLHASEVNAKAHFDALVGIDPKWEE